MRHNENANKTSNEIMYTQDVRSYIMNQHSSRMPDF